MTPAEAAAHPSITLEPDELRRITGGYERTADQLRVLHARGFHRAQILKGVLVLERSHYDAVTRGQSLEASPPRPRLKSQRLKAAA